MLEGMVRPQGTSLYPLLGWYGTDLWEMLEN